MRGGSVRICFSLMWDARNFIIMVKLYNHVRRIIFLGRSLSNKGSCNFVTIASFDVFQSLHISSMPEIPFLSWNLVSNNGQINSNAPLLTALKLNTWANECNTRIYLLQEFRYCGPRIRRWVCIAYSEGLRITNLAVDHVYSKGNLKDEGWHCLPFFCTEFVPGILGPQKTKKRSL